MKRGAAESPTQSAAETNPTQPDAREAAKARVLKAIADYFTKQRRR